MARSHLGAKLRQDALETASGGGRSSAGDDAGSACCSARRRSGADMAPSRSPASSFASSCAVNGPSAPATRALAQEAGTRAPWSAP